MPEDDLQREMIALYQKQKKCLKIQKILIFLTIVFLAFGFIPLFFHVVITIGWGTILANKATALARKKYPYAPMVINSHGGSWDPAIMEEAARRNDDLTVKILQYNKKSLLYCGIGFLGYCFMLKVGGKAIIWLFSLLEDKGTVLLP